MSTIVTVPVQVETLPLTSVTVRVTVLLPTLLQLNVLGETFTVAIPQLSLEPLLIWAAVMDAVPAELRFTVTF